MLGDMIIWAPCKHYNEAEQQNEANVNVRKRVRKKGVLSEYYQMHNISTKKNTGWTQIRNENNSL